MGIVREKDDLGRNLFRQRNGHQKIMTVKTTNSLMKHLRENGIEISGSTEKRNLRNLGYYHLYKGYRFYGESRNKLPFNDFEKIRRTYEYDMELKSMLYRWTIFLETAFKNIILQTTIEYINSESVRDFYDQALECGSSLPAYYKDDIKKKATSKKLRQIKFLQNKISENYNHDNSIILHYYDRNEEVPIWGLFEILTFGDLGHLVDGLKRDLRITISKNLGLKLNDDRNAKNLQHFIFLIKDLRNAIAHDNVIYDGRFIKNGQGNSLPQRSIVSIHR